MNSGDSEMRLQTLLPTCSVCSEVLDGSSRVVRQLSCFHLFCQHCLQELTSSGAVWCPFDEMCYTEISSAGVTEALSFALRCRSFDPNSFPQALDILERSYSLVKVPCVWTKTNGNCPNPLWCKLDHSFNYLHKHACPNFKASGQCWRDKCLFFHQQPTLEQSVVIRSQSFWAHIAQQSGAVWEVISRYGAEIARHEMREVTYQTEKKWVFETKGNELPTAFESETQDTIAYAADHHKESVDLKSFRVYFRPQFLVMSDFSISKVTCTSVCLESSPIGTVVFKVREDWVQHFLTEIQGLEGAVNGVVVGNKQLNWLKSNGFGYYNGQIIGFALDLNKMLATKPAFNEFDDIIEVAIEFNPSIHNLAGKAVVVLPGKLVGLREDVDFVCSKTVSPQQFPVYTLPPQPYPPMMCDMYPPVQPMASAVPMNMSEQFSLPVLPIPRPQAYENRARVVDRGGRGGRGRGRMLSPNLSSHISINWGDPEKAEIERMAKMTLHNVEVLSIDKLPPSAASQDFDMMVESIRRSTGRRPNTMKLFHGTKQIDPRDIAEAGMNDRRGKGKFGYGIYFYENLGSIEGYVYRAEDGEKQVLVCEVITGDCLISEEHTYRCAPFNPNTNREFHSVQGLQRGSKLWVVFKKDMACARFILSYR